MQHPEQGLSSRNTSVDLQAMKKAHNTAISSNERTFPVFAKKLASKDAKEFVNTAQKLTIWLGSEKAYYVAARPKIVELLEIALSAFSETFIHHPAIAEFLRQLIQAVIPFKDLFENELKSRLQRVISDTSHLLSRITSTAHAKEQVEGSVTANIPSPTPTSPVHPQPTIPPVPAPQMPVWQIQAALSTLVAAKEGVDGTIQTNLPQAHEPPQVSSPDQIEAIVSLASPVTNTLQNPGGNISPTVPSKPQPKRARRAELSEELIARDLDWFKSTQSLAIVKEDPAASPSKVGESLLAPVSDAPHVPTQSPSPKKKTARMVPSRRLPRRIPLDATQGVESSVSTSTLPPATELSDGSYENVQDVSIQMDIDKQNRSLESDARAVAVPEGRNVQEVSRPEELLSAGPQPVAVSSNKLSIEPQTSRTGYQSPLVEHPLINGETLISARPSVLLPEAMSDRMESMDISNSDSGTECPPLEHATKPESTPPVSPQMFQLRRPILPPLVNAFEPPLNLNFRISKTSPGQLQQSEIDANIRRFDDEMTVIHSIQGKPFSHTHVIDISMSESIFSKISKWVNRKSRPSDASQGVCISLACYRFQEFFDTVKSENGKHDIETLTLRSSCSWPSSDRLSLHVKDGERRTTIALSPPLFLTPDQCVDVSLLMQPGDNTLEIRQKDDLSEYLVVLHAHPPTRAQLAELDAIKAADERWKRLLDVISAQVVPGKMLGDTCAGVVEVS